MSGWTEEAGTKWVDRDVQNTMRCTVSNIKPEGDIYWQIDDGPVTTTNTINKGNDDRTFSLESDIEDDFSGRGNSADVKCLVVYQDDDPSTELISTQETVQIWCK